MPGCAILSAKSSALTLSASSRRTSAPPFTSASATFAFPLRQLDVEQSDHLDSAHPPVDQKLFRQQSVCWPHCRALGKLRCEGQSRGSHPRQQRLLSHQ